MDIPFTYRVPPECTREKLCHRSLRIPKDFLQLLDSAGSLQSTPSYLVAEKLTPYQQMLCVKHLLIFAQVTSANALSHRVVIAADSPVRRFAMFSAWLRINRWRDLVNEEAKKRGAESQKPEYQPHGPDRTVAPSNDG
jgi:hypothetical protein